MTEERKVHVPNVREESGVTGFVSGYAFESFLGVTVPE
jgi:hypothetical protein